MNLSKGLLAAAIITVIGLTACNTEDGKKQAEKETQINEKVSLNDLSVGEVVYKEGVNYKKLEKPIPSQENEIIEFFWYKCGHCYSFDLYLRDNYKRIQDKGFTVRAEHAAISKNWVTDARVFYTFKQLGKEKTTLTMMMEASHNPEIEMSFEEILTENGIDTKEFQSVYQSDDVSKLIEESFQWAIDAGITGTPSLIVEGKYLLVNGSFKDYDDMMNAAFEIAELN